MYQIKPVKHVIRVQSIVTIHYFELSKNFYYPGESHDFWEMVYVDKGEVIATAEEREIVLTQGQAVFHKPNEFHRLAANNVTAPNVFIITFVCKSRDMRFFREKVIDIPQKLRDLIAVMIEEGQQSYMLPFIETHLKRSSPQNNPPLGGQQMVKLYLEQFLIMLLRSGTEVKESRLPAMNETIDDRLVQDIIKYLESRVFQTVSVNELCQRFNYSKTYLSRVFKNITGRSLLEYYTSLKISEAKRLIREKNLNFTQIAMQLCYDSPQYFSRTFKHVTGMTPKEYKRSVMAD
ncbi:MAG: AraC family transcriptional regulator [Ruminococcaceae bacterium]|nr:AraC family transcriptional regulator [Oscillospiraceae bacterium]